MRRTLEGYQELVEWSSEDPRSLESARAVLRREVEGGYTAVRADGGDNQPVEDLPPDADLVILTMPMGGG